MFHRVALPAAWCLFCTAWRIHLGRCARVRVVVLAQLLCLAAWLRCHPAVPCRPAILQVRCLDCQIMMRIQSFGIAVARVNQRLAVACCNAYSRHACSCQFVDSRLVCPLFYVACTHRLTYFIRTLLLSTKGAAALCELPIHRYCCWYMYVCCVEPRVHLLGI